MHAVDYPDAIDTVAYGIKDRGQVVSVIGLGTAHMASFAMSMAHSPSFMFRVLPIPHSNDHQLPRESGPFFQRLARYARLFGATRSRSFDHAAALCRPRCSDAMEAWHRQLGTQRGLATPVFGAMHGNAFRVAVALSYLPCSSRLLIQQYKRDPWKTWPVPGTLTKKRLADSCHKSKDSM